MREIFVNTLRSSRLPWSLGFSRPAAPRLTLRRRAMAARLPVRSRARENNSGNGRGGSADGEQGNGSNGQGQGKGNGNGQGNGKVEGNWKGTDVAEAPTVSDLGNFTASTIDGGTFSAADLADKDITIVNFWSTTCPPCRAEMPDLAEIQQELPANVQLITVLLDGQSGVQEAQSILTQAGYRGITLVPDGEFRRPHCRRERHHVHAHYGALR